MFGFGTKSSVRTDEDAIQTVLTRGVEQVYPRDDFIRERLRSGERLRIYLGVDPTGPTLHLGHAIPLRKLRQLQDLGHEIILLIGDFTARIGDPDQKDVRKQLTHEEVLANAARYKEQASTFLRFDGANAAQLKFNHEWLSQLGFADVIDLASKMTVQQMLERDMFQRRLKDERPIYIHEFLYPLMQGFDSVAMDVDGEVGGTDQTFNMLAGRTLMKEAAGKEKFVITLKLLADPEGVKMGKTAGNMLSFEDAPAEKYGKVMSWTDGMILPGFELCTDVELSSVQRELDDGANPRDVKMRLAREIVATYHGSDAARRAEDDFVQTFQKSETPSEVVRVSAEAGELLVDVLVRGGAVGSRSEFRRLVDAGAITNKTTGAKVAEYEHAAEPGVYRVGKHRFLEIT